MNKSHKEGKHINHYEMLYNEIQSRGLKKRIQVFNRGMGQWGEVCLFK